MIDVLIPAFNAGRTIESAVRSILDQTVRDLRVIVVDDGSTDDSAAILARLADADPRLEIVTTPNRGIVDALNTGLAKCRSDLVARHDADDIAFPNRLERQIAYLEANPDCVAVGCNVWRIDAEGRRIGKTNVGGEAWGDTSLIPSWEPYLLHPFLTARRSALEAVGGYRYVFHAEDTDLYWRLAPLGRLFSLHDVLGEYRVHSGSITSGSIRNARIGAVEAQLAAISAARRASGREDLPFPRSALAKLQAADDLETVIDGVAADLDEAERRYLEVASAAKMLELRLYREFRFTRGDMKSIAALLFRHRRQLDWRTRLKFAEQVARYTKLKTRLRRLAFWRPAPSLGVAGS